MKEVDIFGNIFLRQKIGLTGRMDVTILKKHSE